MRRLLLIVLLATSFLVVAPAHVSGSAGAPPDTKITKKPPKFTNKAKVKFKFRSTKPDSTFKCKLDKKPTRPCTSPQTWSGLRDGGHLFEVYAIDQFGNSDASPVIVPFVVDRDPPVVSITSGPGHLVVIGHDFATFKFTSDERRSTFKCKLDAAPYAACPSTKSYSGLAQGPHTFRVFATDRAGNKDETPALVTWQVDTIGPTATITSGPDNGTSSGNNDPEFTFTGDTPDATSFECTLDSELNFSVCTSPKQYSDVSDAEHTFYVRACDPVGNCGEPATRTWTVDTSAPDTTITSGPEGTTAVDNDPMFTFTADPATGSTFKCKLDTEAEYSDCQSPKQYTDVQAGDRTFSVAACDVVGNCDASPATRTWTVPTPHWRSINETGLAGEADFCRIQFPLATSVAPGAAVPVFGRIYEAGVTEPAGASPLVSAQLGVGPDGGDPQLPAGWTWVAAPVNSGYSSSVGDDEYQGTLTAPAAAGSYDYAYRFSLDGGYTATYCDADGAGSGAGTYTAAQAGQLTVG